METPTKTPQVAEVKNTYEDCRAQTKAVHNNRTTFSPRLRSVNHLDLVRSRLIRNPVTIILGMLVNIYFDFVHLFRRLGKWMFPRPPKVYGRNFDSQVVGKLTFGQKRADLNVPVHHMHVEVWARTWFWAWRKLGASVSNEEGKFRIEYDLRLARRWFIRTVRLEIFHTGNHKFVNKKPVNDYIRFKKLKIKKSDLVGIEYSFGIIQLFYWEYRKDTLIPRVVIKDHDKDAPQKYALGFTETIEKQFVPIEVTKVKHLEEIELAPHRMSIPIIQADYPENLTVCMEKKEPGITRGDAWFGERIMNGMYASELDKDPQNPELLWVHYHWSSYDRTHDYAMPDVDMYFKLQDNGLPLPVKITLTGPLNAYELDQRPKRSFTPADGDKWMQAKRVARVSAGLYTELAHHFAGTHLNTEQYSIAANRNLRLSPLTTLLFPHLKEVILVNHTADRILVGNGYITQATALTPKGIGQVVMNVMGTLDWRNWQPMKPLSDAHIYAHAANKYWEILTTYVDEYFTQNARDIQKYWHEVYRFSEELVHHSVPSFLCKYLQHSLLDEHHKIKGGDHTEWYKEHHRMDLRVDRPEVNGEPKAVSSITQAKTFEESTEEDWNKLKQACCYMIFQATFGHTWANSKQYDDIGEVLYNSLGLRFGDGKDGVLAPESDTRIAPDLTRSTQMMWWSNMLSRTGYGYIMSNEDGDINPRLQELLEAKRADFAAMGLSIDDLQSRTNI